MVPVEPLDRTFRYFVIVNPLLQFGDQLNPLSDLTQKRRLTGLGPRALKLSNRKIEIRTIHQSYFGRLCPVETPEGHNAGLVNSPTILRRVSRSGRVQVSVVIIANGWFLSTWGNTILRLGIYTFSTQQKIISWTTRLGIRLLNNTLGRIQLRKLST